MSEAFMKFRVSPGVMRRKPCEFARRSRGIIVEAERAAIPVRSEKAHFRLDDREAVTFQIQVARDARQQRASRMGERRRAETFVKLFGDGDSSDLLATLKHERRKTGPRQVRGGDETVVPASDDDDSRLARHYTFPHFRSFKSLTAALRPGAPMIPPPGCVAEPHIYRFWMGVRYCAQPGAGRRKKSCSSVSSP
jgi:hypothetical protein